MAAPSSMREEACLLTSFKTRPTACDVELDFATRGDAQGFPHPLRDASRIRFGIVT
jgi:hypothetical protein